MQTAIRGSYTDFAIWGPSLSRFDLPERVMVREFDSPLEAVSRSIARRNRPIVVANSRLDCHAVSRTGEPSRAIYQITLGKPLRSGGYSVEGELWISVGPGPAPTAHEREINRQVEEYFEREREEEDRRMMELAADLESRREL